MSGPGAQTFPWSHGTEGCPWGPRATWAPPRTGASPHWPGASGAQAEPLRQSQGPLVGLVGSLWGPLGPVGALCGEGKSHGMRGMSWGDPSALGPWCPLGPNGCVSCTHPLRLKRRRGRTAKCAPIAHIALHMHMHAQGLAPCRALPISQPPPHHCAQRSHCLASDDVTQNSV